MLLRQHEDTNNAYGRDGVGYLLRSIRAARRDHPRGLPRTRLRARSEDKATQSEGKRHATYKVQILPIVGAATKTRRPRARITPHS
ncbi:hypothetical protein ZHAS_00006257 [Anopheles sinensis]|uniref:Uncharacterized protein n=1 Tax=Anopheles sinensis TaxID=74873 RepID=A0A084VLF3_ANOSI|nr:hypothetical protein ZHAS_00006257 [Anopheles sinensis]